MDTDGATPPVHPLLARQLRRVGLALPGTPTPEQWTELVSRVSSAYEDGDRQRYIFERSLNIATREMDELT